MKLTFLFQATSKGEPIRSAEVVEELFSQGQRKKRKLLNLSHNCILLLRPEKRGGEVRRGGRSPGK